MIIYNLTMASSVSPFLLSFRSVISSTSVSTSSAPAAIATSHTDSPSCPFLRSMGCISSGASDIRAARDYMSQPSDYSWFIQDPTTHLKAFFLGCKVGNRITLQRAGGAQLQIRSKQQLTDTIHCIDLDCPLQQS